MVNEPCRQHAGKVLERGEVITVGLELFLIVKHRAGKLTVLFLVFSRPAVAYGRLILFFISKVINHIVFQKTQRLLISFGRGAPFNGANQLFCHAEQFNMLLVDAVDA